MPNQMVTILDAERNPAATADVQCRQGHYSGSVNLEGMPASLRELFEEYEGIVNSQTFALLDQDENLVGAIPLVVVFNDGQESRAKDLQIFPTSSTISFEMVEPALLRGSR